MAIKIAILEADVIKRYSIAEARDRFTYILREIEKEPAVEITRRGEPVAVLLSWREFHRLKTQKNFWDAYSSFREQFDLSTLAISPEVFSGVRDRYPGRQVKL
ncbi:MAG: type II toxin-antitoxin system Phd/YefM family antitoxin [Anaerolineales bacterium]|nr:type II toxin-antitoxin system Phd/YefM family antitoxin [Anaerolineales bacterium]